MKTLRLIAIGFVFAAVSAVSAFAQAAPAASGKIGLVNTFAFGDDKGGITKFKTALNSVDAEFKTVNDELKTMGTRYQTLGQEIQKLRTAPATGGSTVPVGNLDAKVEEFQTLETNIKRKQEDAKQKYERRYQQVVGPIYGDILKALNEFAKQKGYAVILDGAKLEESGILMGFDEKYNITTEFIQFYNTRPAGAATATAAQPK